MQIQWKLKLQWKLDITNEVPRHWQKFFDITRFRYISRSFFIYFKITGRDKKIVRLIPRTWLYRGSTVVLSRSVRCFHGENDRGSFAFFLCFGIFDKLFAVMRRS